MAIFVCSGTLAQGTYALNSNKGTRERIGRLLLMHANSREDIDVARTGDIVAVAGLKNIITGETLCDEKNPIILERMDVSLPSSSFTKLASINGIISLFNLLEAISRTQETAN